ncbi:MAG: RsmE family RNA methyltransferase [Ginsengibacter sp.]
MQLPFFYEEVLQEKSPMVLSDESSRHIVQVLRMKEGENIQITNGKGILLTTEITLAHKKKTEVKIIKKETHPPGMAQSAIAISLVKNTGRFEWFLEKATEIGVTEIIPLRCKRTEKSHFREDRMKMILVSAMLQSRQVWLPILFPPTKYPDFISQSNSYDKKFIAHCIEDQKRELKEFTGQDHSSKIVLIGPEGDFTPEEIEQAINEHFIPVSLGTNRLRTETAAIVAAVMLNIS